MNLACKTTKIGMFELLVHPFSLYKRELSCVYVSYIDSRGIFFFSLTDLSKHIKK